MRGTGCRSIHAALRVATRAPIRTFRSGPVLLLTLFTRTYLSTLRQDSAGDRVAPEAVGSWSPAGSDLVRIVPSDSMPGLPTGRRSPPSPHRCPGPGDSHSIRPMGRRMAVVGVKVAARTYSISINVSAKGSLRDPISLRYARSTCCTGGPIC